MGKDIFFVISFLLLGLGLIFVYKVPEKVSLFRSGIICFITELCFGAIVVGIYSIVGVRVGLMSLGGVYLFIGAGIWGIIIYQKKIQGLKMLVEDIYSALILLIWFILVFVKVFSLDISNVYTNSDPARHYAMALKVLDTGKVSYMYFGEVYNGVVLELFEPFVARLSLYKAFILADSFANLLNVFMFYIMTTTFVKHRFTKMVVPFLSFLYFAGWPFFSYVIGGFVYFGWGVTLVAYVVYLLIQLYYSEDRRNQVILLGLVLTGCISVLVCYMLFIVILAGIVFFSLVCIARKNKFVLSPKSKIKIGISILLIGIIAFTFCFMGYFHGNLSTVFGALRTNGGIARELYQDFVFLMPAAIYIGWKYIKNKENNLIFISASVITIYICFTFIICWCGMMSPYYYYKSYYLLWMFVWLLNIAAIEYFLEKDKAVLFSYSSVLLFAIFITMSGIDNELEKKGIVVDEVSGYLYPSPFPIWDRMELFFMEETYSKDKGALVDVCGYIDENFEEQEEIPIIVSDNWFLVPWYESFTGNYGKRVSSDEEFIDTIQEYKNDGYQYIVVWQNIDRFRDNKLILNDYNVIYDNGYYGIYQIF